MISIIVPVYKVEPYLRRCVESVLNQTYHDFELILVDDGSPDDCGRICDEFAAVDSRVRVIHKENGGVSSARNEGLSRAKGQFVAFLDSDDWYHPQALEIWVKAAEQFGADGITAASFWTQTDQITVPLFSYEAIQKHSYTGAQICADFYKLAFSGGTVKDTLTCGLYGMYRRECFGSIRFDESITCGEDVLVLFQLNKNVRTLVHLDVPMYYYFTGNQSAMRSGLSKGQLTVLDALLKIGDVLRDLPQQADKVYYRYLYSYLDFDLRVKRSENPELKQHFAAHRRAFKENFKKFKHNPYLCRMEKIMLRLYMLKLPLYRRIFGKYGPGMEEKLWSFVSR